MTTTIAFFSATLFFCALTLTSALKCGSDKHGPGTGGAVDDCKDNAEKCYTLKCHKIVKRYGCDWKNSVSTATVGATVNTDRCSEANKKLCDNKGSCYSCRGEQCNTGKDPNDPSQSAITIPSTVSLYVLISTSLLAFIQLGF